MKTTNKKLKLSKNYKLVLLLLEMQKIFSTVQHFVKYQYTLMTSHTGMMDQFSTDMGYHENHE